MSRVHCRCRKCDTRKVFRDHPDTLQRVAACPKCQAKDWRADPWMNGRNTSLKGQGCACSGYSFQHRRGSKFCWYRADGTDRMPGDPDFNDRHMTDDEIAQAAAAIKNDKANAA